MTVDATNSRAKDDGNANAGGASSTESVSGVVPYRGNAPFCLQEYAVERGIDRGVLVARFELIDSAESGEFDVHATIAAPSSTVSGRLSLSWQWAPSTFQCRCCSSGSPCSQRKEMLPVTSPSLRKCVEAATSRVFCHLRERHAMLLTSAALEFAVIQDTDSGDYLDVVLAAASAISFVKELASTRTSRERPSTAYTDPIDDWQRSSGDDRPEREVATAFGLDEGS